MDTSSKHKLTISARSIWHFLAGVRASGQDTDQLCRSVGIEPDLLLEADARLPIERVVRLVRQCIALLHDEFSGLLYRPMKPGTFRFVALSVIHTNSLHEAVNKLVEFYNLFDNSFSLAIIQKNKHAELQVRRVEGRPVASTYAIDMLLGPLHRFLSWLIKRRILLEKVTLDFARHDYASEYQHMFYAAPILFNQQFSAIKFDARYLDFPILQTEVSVRNYIQRIPMDLFLPLDAGGETSIDVSRLIHGGIANADMYANLEQVALTLRLNPQTLRRRLKGEGTSFHSLKAQVQRDVAIHYLGEAGLNIEAISDAIGYSEASAFIRAFKQWTGFTPLQFRKDLTVPGHSRSA